MEKGNSNLPVLVRGFPFSAADQIYDIANAIYDGQEYTSRREVLVGRELSEELELAVGDKLVLSVPRSGTVALTVSGFYDLGVASINKSWLFTYLDTAQEIFDFGGRITSIEMTVKDVFQADTVASQLEQKIDNSEVVVENWKEQNEELLSGLEGQRISSAIIQIVIIASVVIAIASVLAISVLQKSPEIGILKAIGASPGDIRLMFMAEASLIGLLGGIAGTIAGWLLGLGLNRGIIAYLQWQDIPMTGTFFVVTGWLVALALVFAVLVGLLAGLYPAARAARLDPLAALRHE